MRGKELNLHNLKIPPLQLGISPAVKYYCLCGLLVMLGWAAPVLDAYGQTTVVSHEYEIKAEYLYNFMAFVSWPEEAFKDEQAPFTVGLVGKDPFGARLEEAVKGKTLRGKPIAIKRIADATEVEGCQLVFISKSEKENLCQLVAAIQKPGVMTVGELEGFNACGGVVKFLIQDNKVKFEVNVDAARRANLKISSKMLKVAQIYREEPVKQSSWGNHDTQQPLEKIAEPGGAATVKPTSPS